jgi:hypothetical protein
MAGAEHRGGREPVGARLAFDGLVSRPPRHRLYGGSNTCAPQRRRSLEHTLAEYRPMLCGLAASSGDESLGAPLLCVYASFVSELQQHLHLAGSGGATISDTPASLAGLLQRARGTLLWRPSIAATHLLLD